MSNRAYIPDSPGRLEGRVLLSGALRLHPEAVHLSAPLFNRALFLTRGYYEQYALSGDRDRLRNQLQRRAEDVPFGRIGGLGPKINATLDRMEAELAAGTPGAIRRAYRRTVAGFKAVVVPHIRDGSVVVDE